MVHIERRIAKGTPRIPFDRKVQVAIPEREKPLVGYARNLSQGGMSVVGGVQVPPETKVRLGFELVEGNIFHADARVVRTIDDQFLGKGVGLLFEDVDETHQKILQEAVHSYPLKQRFVQFSLLSEKILSGLTVSEILNHVYDSFHFLIPYDRIGFAKLDDSGQLLQAMWARTDKAKVQLPVGYVGSLKGSSLAAVLKSREARIINDLPEYLNKHPKSDSTRKIVAEGMQASLTCPLIAFQKPFGFLFFSSFQPHVYETSHVETFQFLAAQLSYAIEKGFLFEELLATKKRLETANRHLLELSTVDATTGIRNRRFFDQRLSEEWKRAVRNQHPLSLIMLDVDHFKAFNDLYGHAAGDVCLRKIGDVLKKSLRRPTEFVARYGGEEFVALLADTPAEKAEAMAHQLREQIELLSMKHEGNPGHLKVTASLGVATVWPSVREPKVRIVEAADQALYAAKNNGRNCVHIAHRQVPRYTI